ncbi:uncharacterized protein RJT20DRAFT_133782 [Scheffersomyces xylosifermentans]|uniref:uncharacterized protein n=1 Tax=Scheffersomyces xylosifermentans TaxID=1304137 RepID=UPI00315D3E34
MSDSEDSSVDTNEYTIRDYYKLIKPLWAAKDINASYLNNHKLLRTLVDFSLSHSLYLKNLQKRELELGDIIPTKINYVDALVIRTPNHNNLNNSENPNQFYGCFRNRYVEFCPHLAIAVYLFSRFHIPDEYGSLEFMISDYSNKLLLEDVKLLKGNNKLSAISYSQQHKSSINALSLSGLNYKDINLNKLLLTQSFEVQEKLVSLDIEHLSHNTMLNLAGFDSFTNYNIARNSIEPPEELLEQIFPFINKQNPDESEGMAKIRQLLLMLRRTLCQDMVIIKRKYPSNPVSRNAIFNSELFANYCHDMEAAGIIEKTPTFIPPEEEDWDMKPDFEGYESGSSATNMDLQKIIDIQNSKIKTLDEQLNNYYLEQRHIFANLSDFIERQNEVFQRQSEYMQKIQNSTNGLLVLLSSRNKNMIPLAQQSLSETSEFITSINNTNIKQGLNNTIDLLAKLNSNTQHQQQSFVSITNNQSIYNQHAIIQPGFTERQQSQYPPQPPMTPKQLERQTVLNRRLSRQATTLFEMWDDFKGLEQDLKTHEITVTEWLKVHGSSERQFRHTRLKIIKFIEDESARRNCSVEFVKEKLHNKMRNRLRPWTLDEVQRMLTSGKRIDLDN